MNFKTELELKDMSKKEIDAHGDSIGMKLDRRLKKEKLIKQVMDFQSEQTKEEMVEPVADEASDVPLVPAVEPYDIGGSGDADEVDTAVEAPEFDEERDPTNWMIPVGVILVVCMFIFLIVEYNS